MPFRGVSRWRELLCCALAWAVGLNGAVSLQLKVIEGEGAEYRTGSRASHGPTVLVTDESGKPVVNALVSFRLPEAGATGTFNSGLPTEIVTTGQDGRATVSGVQWNSNPGQVALRITAMKDQARAGIITTLHLSDKLAAVSESVRTQPDAVAANFEVAPTKSTAEKFTAAPVKIEPVHASNEVTLATPKSIGTNSEMPPVTGEALAPKPGSAGGEGVFSASHGGYGKWILITAVVVGGAAAGLVFGMSKSSSPTPTTSVTGITIGSPTIIVGHP